MRSTPVCCVLGHVDVGKTQLLDRLREAHQHTIEAGGITQQIGLTVFPHDVLTGLTAELKSKVEIESLAMVDTPGHDVFTQIRTLGTTISDLAIVVIDLFKGVEVQTQKVLELLIEKNLPYIIALNKVDRIYKWKKTGSKSLKKCLSAQSSEVMDQFRKLTNNVITQLNQIGILSALYYENPSMVDYISIVPMSALTGEGLADLVLMISKITMFNFKKQSEVLQTYGYLVDIKKDEQFGVLYHVILINGELKRGDHISFNQTVDISDIYIPVSRKSQFALKSVPNVSGTCSLALKFANSSQPLPLTLGSKFIMGNIDSHEHVEVLNNTPKTVGMGMVVNVPSQSLADAVIQTFQGQSVQITQTHVGAINKALIIKTASCNLAPPQSVEFIYNQRFSVILNYDPNSSGTSGLSSELTQFAEQNHVIILTDNIIYKLLGHYEKYVTYLNQQLRKMYPNICKSVKMTILPQFIFMKQNPLLVGVKIDEGQIKIGLPLHVTKDDKSIILGSIISIQKNNKAQDSAKYPDEICLKIEIRDNKLEYGKQYDHKWLVSNYLTDNEKNMIAQYPDVFGENCY